MITYLIIDDEPLAHDIIKGYCDMLPDMQLGKSCYDAFEALDYLKEKSIDLIFLDLNMPKLKGFAFLKTLPSPPKVIVTTAYKEHALEGYELEITDYLLKPFSLERFLKAVNKVQQPKTSVLKTSVSKAAAERIFFYTDKQHIQVKINDIQLVEAAGNYAKVILNEDEFLVREKISEVLDRLSKSNLIQVHKSFLVAKDHIHKIEGNSIIIGKHRVPIGKFYKANVLRLLE